MVCDTHDDGESSDTELYESETGSNGTELNEGDDVDEPYLRTIRAVTLQATTAAPRRTVTVPVAMANALRKILGNISRQILALAGNRTSVSQAETSHARADRQHLDLEAGPIARHNSPDSDSDEPDAAD